jgi:hypothetical protein
MTLFDFNFQAFGIPADECFAAATEADANPKELKPGEERKVGYPEHYSVERKAYKYTAGSADAVSPVPANDNNPPIAVAA